MSKSRAGGSAGREAATPGPTAAARMPTFDRALPMLLLWAREAMMQRFRPSLNERGLTDQQWRIIRALVATGPCEIYDLSARCCLHPASLSRILPKLAASGIVSRSPNAQDHRRVVVTLTPQGRCLYEEAIERANEIYAGMARDIGAERIERATAMLEDLIAALGEHAPDGIPRVHGEACAVKRPHA